MHGTRRKQLASTCGPDEPLSSQISVEAWLRSDQWELADGGPAG